MPPVRQRADLQSLTVTDQGDEEGGGASRTTAPAAGSSTGTDVSIRDHYDALRRQDRQHFEDLRHGDELLRTERDRRYEDRYQAQQKALDHAQVEVKEWRAASNEWRATLSDLTARLPSRAEVDAAMAGLTKELARQADELSEQRTLIAANTARGAGADDSRAERRLSVAGTVGLVGVILAAMAVCTGLIVAVVH